MATTAAPPGSRDTVAFDEVWYKPRGILGVIRAVQGTTIGTRYMITAFVFLLIGGVESMIIRIQLTQPGMQVVDPQTFNELFTMHGTTMMFLFAVPFLEGLATYLLPVQLGTRDMPFPRYNAFNYWCYLFAGILLYSSFFVGLVPDSGWFAYVPLSGPEFADKSMDIWLFGLALAELAAIGAAIEIIVAVLKTRAPGMSMDRMPVFAWTMLSVGLLILVAFVPLLVASTLLEFDRAAGTVFFIGAADGDPLLWQHLFWIFGHPEVYVLFLPGAAVISHIVPIHVRCRLAAYPLVVVAVVVTAIMSLGLWVHHMYVVGLPPVTLSFFTAASMAITVASGIQIFSWISTLWLGRPRFTVPLLFALGFIVTFVAGGVTGVMVASAGFDAQVHDTYFIVAHLHYVLIGGLLFPIFAALVHWWPKFTGRMVNAPAGYVSFWLIFVGFHVTFFPMHLMGLWGMPRRVYTYLPGLGLETANLVSTIGAFILALGVGILTLALIHAWKWGEPASDDPWRGDSLEWAVASPPPPANHDVIPVVAARHPRWDEPAPESQFAELRTAFDHGPTHTRLIPLTTIVAAQPDAAARTAPPTAWPIVPALGLVGAAIGMLVEIYPMTFASLGVVLLGLFGWAWRNEKDMSAEDVAPYAGLDVEIIGPRGLSWWGAIGACATVLLAVATIGFSVLFLQVNAGAWTSRGTLDSPVTMGLIGVAAIIGAAASWWGSRGPRTGRETAAATGGRSLHLVAASVGVVAGLIGLALTLTTWMTTDLDHQAHAYASSVLVLLVAQGFALAVATAMSVIALMARLLHERDLRARMLLHNATWGWATAVCSWAIVWTCTDLLPATLI
ncbi:MAG: cbb3-type cytochrome c oxidase subunit I [Mobilicoccus sp.]|nr:cbb3-type cytochrome c oxidase subunit I [Mobilicoccus sp.]